MFTNFQSELAPNSFMASLIVSLIGFEFITLLIDFFLFINKFQIQEVIDSAIDEAREIFERKDDINNETVKETSTEEIPEQAAE